MQTPLTSLVLKKHGVVGLRSDTGLPTLSIRDLRPLAMVHLQKIKASERPTCEAVLMEAVMTEEFSCRLLPLREMRLVFIAPPRLFILTHVNI